MRDTSMWTSSPYTSKPYVALSVRQRYPGFRWRDGSMAYALPGLGEDWGDSPGTVIEQRERGLPARRQHGGFVVASDSVTIDHAVLRVTSLAAGNQDTGFLWYKTDSVPALASYSPLTFNPAPRPWTGIGLTEHGSDARLFYISNSDNRLVYVNYSAVAIPPSFESTVYSVAGSPSFNYDGTAIAPVSVDDVFVVEYDPVGCAVKLHHYDGQDWVSTTVSPRVKQHPLNCHWFDAVALGPDRLVTFNINGVQYATLYNAATGFRDPWPVLAFDPEFGGAQTRICKLTKIGSRVYATAWSRFAGSSDDYEVSYYHLLWTDDGVHWAMPEEGYIGQTACRGKLHLVGTMAWVVGSSVTYVGDGVAWLGGSTGVQTAVAGNVAGHNLIQDLDKATDAKLPLLIPDSFDKSLFTAGNELVFQLGLQGQAAIDIAHLTLDTPGETLEGNAQGMEMVGRGPLKRLIAAQAPMDQTFAGAEAYHADFTVGSLYARAGTWSHETAGVAYCERHDGTEAVATVGVQYSGQFQISTRVRITKSVDGAAGGVVFWYEGPQDYWRVELSESGVLLRQYEGGVETVLAAYPINFTVDAWFDLLVRYSDGYLVVWTKPGNSNMWDQAIMFGDWSSSEPQRWYAGLFCVLPGAKTAQALDLDATHAVAVTKTTGFPDNGEIQVNDEIIAYSSKTGVQFGTGEAHSLIRGVRSVRASHPEESPVIVAGRRFEADRFSIFQDGRAMSVADACATLVTSTGVPFQSVTLLDTPNTGGNVYPELHGHSWVLNGEYSGTFALAFWTNTTNPPQAGIQLLVFVDEAILLDIASGIITRYPLSIASDGIFRCQVQTNTIFLWVNGHFVAGFHVPGKMSARIGAVACDPGVTRVVVDELFEVAEGVVWSMQESARAVLQRLLDGRDALLRERSDGSVQVTLLEKRDNLGTLNGTYFVVYQRAAADEQWASAMVTWGAEEWVMVMEPTADRLRWTQWQTPHIYDRTTLRHRAMRKLRKLWSLKDLRVLRGPYDPRIEVGDEVYIDSIRGIPSGHYLVRSVEVIGEPALLDMKVTVQALPAEIPVATWPIKPGIDRPTEGV